MTSLSVLVSEGVLVLVLVTVLPPLTVTEVVLAPPDVPPTAAADAETVVV